MNFKLEQQLSEKYFFFCPDPTLKNNLMAFGFECDDGWYNLISELCEKLDKLIKDKYPDLMEVRGENHGYPNFFVTQVKEKYGELCFYISSAPEEIFDLIDEYITKSRNTCEVCGEPGETLVKNHWYKTVCPKHAEELGYV